MENQTPEKSFETEKSEYDIFLVVPPTYPEGREPDYNPKPPLGLEYLSGYLKNHSYCAKILDFDVIGASSEEVANEILQNNPPVLGITVLQRALPSVKYIHNKLRENEYEGLIIYGGIGATLCSNEILEEFKDSNCIVITGEGEEPLLRLMNSLRDKTYDFKEIVPNIKYWNSETNDVIENNKIAPLNPDAIPWPDRQNLELYIDKSGYLTMLTSRGCPWSQCSFCSNAAFEKLHNSSAWRSRSPDDVVNEMLYLYERTGIKKFKTNDPNLFGKGKDGEKYVIELCKKIEEAKASNLLPKDLSIMSFIRGEDIAGKKSLLELMKSVGFDRLLIGVESSVNEILIKKFRKGETIETLTKAIKDLKESGISPVIGFLIFNPYTTLDTLEKDIQFLEENNLRVNLSKSLRIFNNTPLQFMLTQENRLERNSPFDTYHEYFVSEEISAIYNTMKVMHVLIEDPIRKISQDKIWEIKNSGHSFDKRFAYENLVDIFWSVEIELLKSSVNYYKNRTDNKETLLKESIEKIFYILNNQLFEALSINQDENLVTSEQFYFKISDILNKKDTNNLHEEYVWEVI